MSAIFIGYRRDDGGHARALYEKLLDWFDAGQVFLDHENLALGAKFRPGLEQAAQGCRVFLAVIGPHLLSDKNRERLQDPDDITRGEIRGALQYGKPIIPVLAGGAGFPAKSTLPADIQEMCGNNAHHQLETQFQPAFHTLLATLEKNHGFIPHYRRRDGSPAPFHLIDLPPTRYFADPVGHLPELRRTLEAQGAAAVIAAATVHGMGGVGKTQLALKYSEVYRAEYAGVWWFCAENSGQIKLDCREMCGELGIPTLEGEPPHQAVKRWLQTQPRWLLVYDNAENKDALSTVGMHLPVATASTGDRLTARRHWSRPGGTLLRASADCVPMRSACCYTTVSLRHLRITMSAARGNEETSHCAGGWMSAPSAAVNTAAAQKQVP